MLLRHSLFVLTVFVCSVPAAFAEESGTGAALPPWTVRQEQAHTFDARLKELPIAQREAAWTKWQNSRNKLADHLDRCRFDVRHANRDTLLPVTLKCYRGQLSLELESLKRSGTAPFAHSQVLRDELQKRTADLQGAIQTTMDGIDAKVFTTIAALKDVRRNLLTQYRQPFWFALSRARAGEALAGTAKIQMVLRVASEDAALPATAAEKIADALMCEQRAESFFLSSSEAVTIEESRTFFDQGRTAFEACSLLIEEAKSLRDAAVQGQ